MGGWGHLQLLMASCHVLLLLLALVLLVNVVVSLVDLSFVDALLEVGLVSTDAVGGTVRCRCSSFGIALQLCGRVGAEDLVWWKR